MESISPEEISSDPISVYTGAEAVEDGTLVDLIKFTRSRGGSLRIATDSAAWNPEDH